MCEKAARLPPSREDQLGDFLKAVGTLAILAGGYLLVYAYMTGITVTVSGEETVNFGLIAGRSDTIAIGAALFISGWIALAAGFLGDRIDAAGRRIRNADSEPSEPPTDY